MMRTHHCGELRPEHVGQTVTVAGWCHSSRDHGGVIFLDLRDRSGLAQIVFNPEDQADAHQVASAVHSEWVLKIDGLVRRRPEGTENPNLATGEIEVVAAAIKC